MLTKTKPKIKIIKNSKPKFAWYSISNPRKTEIQYLKNNFKFHQLDLEDCRSKIQRPKIDEYPEYLFIIFNIPATNKSSHITKSQIYFFIGKDFLVSLHDNNSTLKKTFTKIGKNKKIQDDYMKHGAGYLLYMLVDDLFEAAFPKLDELDKKLDKLEKKVFNPKQSHDRLREILNLKKDIINFRRIIMPQRELIAALENKKILKGLEIYFDNIVDKIEKIWNNLEYLKELIVTLHDTSESIVSHNTNNIIKLLTLFSVVILPLTFITGFYGMNIAKLPFAESPISTIIVSGILLFTAVIMLIFFRYKRWI